MEDSYTENLVAYVLFVHASDSRLFNGFADKELFMRLDPQTKSMDSLDLWLQGYQNIWIDMNGSISQFT